MGCVQTVKNCLKKVVEDGAAQEDWDELVAWVALGYRITPQDATRISPYHMLYAQQPSIPSAIRDKVMDPLDPEDSEAAATELARRAKLVAHQVHQVIAAWNVRVVGQGVGIGCSGHEAASRPAGLGSTPGCANSQAVGVLGRLILIYGQRQGPLSQRCVWVIVFRARHVAEMERRSTAQHWAGLKSKA